LAPARPGAISRNNSRYSKFSWNDTVLYEQFVRMRMQCGYIFEPNLEWRSRSGSNSISSNTGHNPANSDSNLTTWLFFSSHCVRHSKACVSFDYAALIHYSVLRVYNERTWDVSHEILRWLNLEERATEDSNFVRTSQQNFSTWPEQIRKCGSN